MKAIVGSSNLWPTPALASMLLTIIASCDPNETFAVRVPFPGSIACSSMTEDMVIKIADRLGRKWKAYPPDRSAGSRAGWIRDQRLVGDVDEVFAFLMVHEKPGGTEHVMQTAMVMDKPVSAWEFTEHGFTEWGENP